jgi:hypothetical protein
LNVVWAGKFAAASIFVGQRVFWQQRELSAKQAKGKPYRSLTQINSDKQHASHKFMTKFDPHPLTVLDLYG